METQIAGSHSEFLIWNPGWALSICISNKFPVLLDAAGWGPTLGSVGNVSKRSGGSKAVQRLSVVRGRSVLTLLLKIGL